MEKAEDFLKKQEKEISVLHTKLHRAYWDALISGKSETYKEYETIAINVKKFFNNKNNLEKVKEFLKKAANEIEERQLKLLYDSYLSCQGDFALVTELTEKASEVEKKFNTFRAKINGKEYTDNEIREILKTETNSDKLREIWEASKKQGKFVEKEILEIIRLRNKLAKSLGFRDYYEFSLETNEQKEEEIEKIFNELVKLTEEPFKKLKEEMDSILTKKYKTTKLSPWHYGDLFFQTGPLIYEVNLDSYFSKDILEKAKKYYKSIGLEIKSILERSDLYEKPGKYQHACCMDMDRKGDVRTIQNLKNNEYWMETLLHELGHGIYSSNHDSSLPFLLRDSAHIFTTEAIALLFGRKSRNPDFIKNYCGIDKIEAEKVKENARKMLRLRELIFARWEQVMFRFERELYKNPEQDLNKLWWALVKKYQLIDFSRDEPDWASKIHIVSSPVYYHNYMLGELLASQLHAYITRNITKNPDSDYSGNKKVGEFLIESIFKPGASYRWDEMIKLALGESLTAKYFVEEFA